MICGIFDAGQLHIFRNEKIDAFGAHEAESVDNHKKTVGIFADGAWVSKGMKSLWQGS